MGKSPAVSVVITCFNYGNYLADCLESVLAQTFNDYEIVLVDDGSTDDTPQVIQQYSALENLRCFCQKNNGQANAKNQGIREAKGKFIAFLDADDIWANDKLEKQIKLFKNKSVGVVFSRARYIDEKGADLKYEPSVPYLAPRSGMVSDWLFIDNFVPFSSSIVLRACFDRFGFFDESMTMGIDWDMWLKLSTCYRFDYIDEPLIAYRIGHSGQMSKNKAVRQKCSDKIMENFLIRFPRILDKKTIRKAYYYTYCNRGSYFRNINIFESFKFFFRAIIINPYSMNAYKGMVKNVLQIF